MRNLVLAFTIALVSSAAAGTAIEPVTAGSVTISLPKGWKTSTDADKGVFVAQKDPSRKDAPAMLVMVQTSGVTATDDQLIDALLAQAATDVKIIERKALNPGKQVIAEGTTGGVKARIAAIAIVGNNGAIIGLLAAKPTDFTALGGAALVAQVLTSIKMGAATTTTAPVAEPPQAGGGITGQVHTTQPVDVSKGHLPQLAKAISFTDLNGEWKDAGSSVSGLFNAQTGNYVGFDAVLSQSAYAIAADGSYKKQATHVALGSHVAAVQSSESGKIIIAGPQTIRIAPDVKGAPVNYYVVRGWYVNGGQTVMKLNGPWHPRADGTLDPEAFNEDGWGGYAMYWARGK